MDLSQAPASEVRMVSSVASLMLAVIFQWRAIRHLRWGLSHPGHEDQSQRVIRGFRDGILAIGLGCLAVAAWRWSWPWALFALVFLGEEIVETGIMLLADKVGRRKG